MLNITLAWRAYDHDPFLVFNYTDVQLIVHFY